MENEVSGRMAGVVVCGTGVAQGADLYINIIERL